MAVSGFSQQDLIKLGPDEVERKRKLAEALLAQSASTAPIGHWTQGAARLAQALSGKFQEARLDKAEQAGMADAAKATNSVNWANVFGENTGAGSDAPAYPKSVADGGSPSGPSATGVASGAQVAPEIRDGIVQSASSLGIDPVDLATAISYETAGTFDPRKKGPRTKWGQHEGFIQFGEPQAQQYGVDWNDPIKSQLGTDGAVVKYLRDRGVKPGMGMLDIYSTINAGGPGLYDRSDEAAGGAPGTVRDKVTQQMAGHRAKALAMFGDGGQQPVQVASLDPSSGMGGNALPGAAQGIGGVAHEQVPPVFTPEQAQMASSPMQQPQGVGIGNVPAGSGGQPVLDVTQVPQLSFAAGLPFQGAPQGQPQANPMAQALIQGGQGGLSPQGMAAHDKALGGILAGNQPQQTNPQNAKMAQALLGQGQGQNYFPPAPDQNRAPIPPQGGGFPAAPQQPAPQDNIQQLMAVINHPYASREQKMMAANALQTIQQRSDPANQLDMEYKRAQLDALKAKPTTKYGFTTLPDGTVVRTNEATGIAEPIMQAGQKPTSDIQEYEYAVKNNGYQGTFPEYQQTMKKAGAGSTNINTGEGNDFYKELDKKNAEMFSTLQGDANTARTNLVRIGQIENLLANVPTGAVADFKRMAGNYGIETEGLDNIQAAQALINQIVPQQRPPGSGAMSDADLELFKQSVPRIINQPGGNKIIIDTMRGIAQYTAQQGDIATRVANREITPAQGRNELSALKNPLQGYGAPKEGDVVDDYRFKGGDPADEKSWEKVK